MMQTPRVDYNVTPSRKRRQHKQQKVLLSFTAKSDKFALEKNIDGPVLVLFENGNSKFDEVHLLYTPTDKGIDYGEVAKGVANIIKDRKYAKTVKRVFFDIKNPVDHNEIYPLLLEKCLSIVKVKKGKVDVVAGISSGTPAMQACWLILAESNDLNFPLHLLRTNEPEYEPRVVEVKLETTLRRIVDLERKVAELEGNFPKLIIRPACVKIGDVQVNFSEREFVIYKYMAELAKHGEEYMRMPVNKVPQNATERFDEILRKTYPQTELQKIDMSMTTFRSWMNKINKRISRTLKNKKLYEVFKISVSGGRGSKSYGLKIHRYPSRIEISE